jgi:hypothetical protein
MQYAMFIVVDPEATEADDAAAPAIEDWFEYMIGKGSYLQGIRLQPKSDATTVRVRNGKVLIADGPFTESKEWIAGLAIIECEDLDAAIEQALKHNMAYQGRLEIRPIHSMGGPEAAERKGRLRSGRRHGDVRDGRLVGAGPVRRQQREPDKHVPDVRV